VRRPRISCEEMFPYNRIRDIGTHAVGENLVSWKRPRGLDDVIVLTATNCTRGFEVFHDSYDVCEISRGACDYHYRGKRLVGAAGALQLFEPGELHRSPKVISVGDVRVLHLPREMVAKYAETLDLTRVLHWKTFQIDHPRVFGMIQRLHDCLERRSPLLEVQSRFTVCLETLLLAGAEAPPSAPAKDREPSAVRRGRDLLLSRIAEDVSLNEVAEASGLSVFRFIRAFRACYGCPPHAYLMRARLTEARQLLNAGESPSQTAAATGFFDQSHLTKYFRRTWWVTPGEYVRSLRG